MYNTSHTKNNIPNYSLCCMFYEWRYMALQEKDDSHRLFYYTKNCCYICGKDLLKDGEELAHYISLKYFYWWILDKRKEGKAREKYQFVVPLFIHSLVDSCMCLTGDPTHNLTVLGPCSNWATWLGLIFLHKNRLLSLTWEFLLNVSPFLVTMVPILSFIQPIYWTLYILLSS